MDVPEDANFVTCSFCETRLSVERTDTTFSTAVLEEIQDTTDALSREVRYLQLQNELNWLHSDWARDRVRFMKRTKNGGYYVPTVATGNLVRILAVISGCIGVIGSVLAWEILPAIVGVIFALIGNLVGLAAVAEAQAYNRAFGAMKRREAAIIAEMNVL